MVKIITIIILAVSIIVYEIFNDVEGLYCKKGAN